MPTLRVSIGPTGPGCIAPGEGSQVVEVVPVDLEPHVFVLLDKFDNVVRSRIQLVSALRNLRLEFGHPCDDEGHDVHT